MDHQVPSDPPSLWIGPGARLEELAALLETLGSKPASTLADAGDLYELGAGERRVLWDADALSSEDLGFLRRHLARSAGTELVLVGEDLTRRAVRALLGETRVRFLAWPPDLDDLRRLAGPALAPKVLTPARARARPSPVEPATRSGEDEQLAEIESILRGGESAEPRASEPIPRASEPIARAAAAPASIQPAASAPAAPPDEREAPLETSLEFQRQLGEPAPAEPATRARLDPPPAYFRDQVADLADIAQRIQLSVEMARGEPKPDEALQDVEQEVERLLQFTRTLGFLVAPPAPGAQNFDLTEMVEVFLASSVAKGPDAPRILFRDGGKLPVRSDRALLSQALDAFLFLAQSCAGKGEIVRVQTRAENDQCVLSIEFPPGPLSDLEPEQVLTPYGLRRAVPKLGPNALAAATGIVAGQGGRALLERSSAGRLGWRVELPRARATGRG